MCCQPSIGSLALLLASALVVGEAAAPENHAIFAGNMAIQSDKSIMIWGWVDKGVKVPRLMK